MAVFCVAVVFALVACVGKNNSPALDTETENQIKQDYLAQFIVSEMPDTVADSIIIKKYYGTYNGYVVITTNYDDRQLASINIETIGNVEFNFSSYRIIVWKNGAFYTLREVYEQGHLTQANLEEISKSFHEFFRLPLPEKPQPQGV
jgi:hypothetical protein